MGENPQERTLEIQCLNCGAKSAAYYGCDCENVEMVEVAECGIREGSELQKECVHTPVHQPDSRSHRERRQSSGRWGRGLPKLGRLLTKARANIIQAD